MGLFDFFKKKELDEISTLKGQLEKYKAITDIEKEVAEKKGELDKYISSKQLELNSTIEIKTKEMESIEVSLNTLNSDYKQGLETYTKLKKEISLYESKLDLVEFGIYEPIYDFEKSDDYRREQALVIDKQKAMIQSDLAAICNTKWTVGDSEAKGRAVVNRYKKLMLRAFNGESDALVAKVKWNNVNQMKERMRKLFDAVNKLGEGFNVYSI